MSEMVERVARAIARSVPIAGAGGSWNPGHGDKFPQQYSDSEQRLIREIARAAIEAMREPTEAMKLAPPDLNPGVAGFIWQDMIDAALK